MELMVVAPVVLVAYCLAALAFKVENKKGRKNASKHQLTLTASLQTNYARSSPVGGLVLPAGADSHIKLAHQSSTALIPKRH